MPINFRAYVRFFAFFACECPPSGRGFGVDARSARAIAVDARGARAIAVYAGAAFLIAGLAASVV